MTLDVAATDTEVRVVLQIFLVSGIGFGWPQILVAGLPLVLDQICALLVGILRTWVHQVFHVIIRFSYFSRYFHDIRCVAVLVPS